MAPLMSLAFCLILGVAAGALAVFAFLRPRMGAQTAEIARLRAQIEAAAESERVLAELRSQTSSLRHDLRGILSPALLSADRLTSSQDPAIRRSGDIVIRSVERATARLAETRVPQDGAKSPQG